MVNTAVRGPTTRAGAVVLTLGVVYLALSVIGFVTVGWHQFGQGRTAVMLGFLGVSTLSNIAHGLIGLVLTGTSLRGWASGIAPVATIVFVAFAVFGTVARIFGGRGDPLNLNWWNVGLYVLSAVAAVYAYVAAVRRGPE